MSSPPRDHRHTEGNRRKQQSRKRKCCPTEDEWRASRREGGKHLARRAPQDRGIIEARREPRIGQVESDAERYQGNTDEARNLRAARRNHLFPPGNSRASQAPLAGDGVTAFRSARVS
jgi:hypothetical protein